MSENTNESDDVCQPTSAEATTVDEGQGTMARLRICPRKVLASLYHLRIDGARIKPIESQTPKAGGKADVVAAILTSGQSSSASEPEVPEYVAVKKLRFDIETNDDHALAPFAHEVSLLNDLSHDNVVKIFGFVEDAENGVAWMVFLWEKNGNLREFVRAEKWELPERVSLIADVAEGLSYLHGRNPPICHGDLKSLNILVNSGNRAVLTDFGSARFMDLATDAVINDVIVAKATKRLHQTFLGTQKMEPLKTEVAESGEFITMTGPTWTVRWAAPELLDGVLPSLGSDVWAFGWICWEAVTGNFPFDDENDVAVTLRIMTQDLPTLRDNSQLNQIKMLCSLMEECLRLGANERPSAMLCQQRVSWMNQMIPLHRSGDSLATTRSSGLLNALGWIELQTGVMARAEEYFGQSLEVSKSVGDERGKAGALNALGEAYRLQNDYSRAEESYIQSRDIYSKIGSQLGFAGSVMALGDVYRVRAEYSKAEESCIQSRDLYSQIGDQLGFAQSVRALGAVYYMQAEYSKAEACYIQSRHLYSKLGHQLGLAQSIWAMGAVYYMRTEYSKAEESYIQSRDLYSKLGNQLGFTHSVQALGDVYSMRAEYSKAEESYIQSRDLYSQLGSQLGLAQSIEGMGRLHFARREYAKAEESYLEAQRIYHRIGAKYSLANISWFLGYLRRDQAQYGEAERLIRDASTIYGELGLKKRVADCEEFIAEINET